MILGAALGSWQTPKKSSRQREQFSWNDWSVGIDVDEQVRQTRIFLQGRANGISEFSSSNLHLPLQQIPLSWCWINPGQAEQRTSLDNGTAGREAEILKPAQKSDAKGQTAAFRVSLLFSALP